MDVSQPIQGQIGQVEVPGLGAGADRWNEALLLMAWVVSAAGVLLVLVGGL